MEMELDDEPPMSEHAGQSKMKNTFPVSLRLP